jgi:hypothetical protein
MAAAIIETQVLWAAASSKTVSAATIQWSDAMSCTVLDDAYQLQVSADNAGTPASGDYVDFYWKSSTGDVLGDSANDYETDEHATYLGRVDTVAANTPGEDPARKYFELPVGATAGKLSYKCNQAATRNIVLRARITEVRAA